MRARAGRLDSTALLAIAIVVGVAAPPLAAMLRPFVYPSIFFLMLLSLLAIDLPGVLRGLRADAGPVVAMSVWQLFALPAMLALFHLYTPLGGRFTELAFYTACAATIFGAPAFARLMRLDESLSLKGTLVAVLIMPVTLPLLVAWVRGDAADFDLAGYGSRLLLFLVLPMALALACHSRPAIGERLRRAAIIRHGSVFFLCLFAVGIMDGVGVRFVESPAEMAAMLGAAFAIHAGLFAAGALPFFQSDRRVALTAGLLASYRNLGLLLAVAGPMLPGGFIVFVALWQVPMYLTPLVLKSFNRRLAS